MEASAWFALIGALFIFMALTNTLLSRLPLSTAMLYLGFGFLLAIPGHLRLEPLAWSALLERLSEIVVIVSLFTAGLKLRTPLSDRRWITPVRLALLSMVLTVAMVTLVGVTMLALPLGAAVLLGAVLAPTDPVLASDVQVADPSDQDRLRFSLTGEAGLNDGTAFPFVMLGLGLLGLHEIGAFGWRWFAVDVVWAIAAGIATGALMGSMIGRLVLYLRKNHKEAVGLDDFLSLGLIGLSYGVALLIHSYGFLAVFAAGVALRRIESRHSQAAAPAEVEVAASGAKKEEVATDPEQAPAYMAQAVLGFNEQLERILVVGMVALVGAMLHTIEIPPQTLWLAPLFFLGIRPLAIWPAVSGVSGSRTQRLFIAWFGIRGIGSLYYLMFAIEHGVPRELAQQLATIALTIIAISIVIHGISVTPLMAYYARRGDSHNV
jgi:sodium/hydrogen antiporter